MSLTEMRHMTSVKHPEMAPVRPLPQRLTYLSSKTWRFTLVIACAAAFAGAMLASGQGSAIEESDEGLAILIKGMALIKAALAMAAAGLVWWRLRFPISQTFAAAYVSACASAVGATVLIFKMTELGLAAVLFHGALIGFLILAWRDDASVLLPGQARRPAARLKLLRGKSNIMAKTPSRRPEHSPRV